MIKRGIAVLVGLISAAVIMLDAIASGEGARSILQGLFALVVFLAAIELAKRDDGGEGDEYI